jgi:hypothetical protein
LGFERGQIKLRGISRDELRGDFANGRGEFETVTGAWTDQQNLGMLRMEIDEEMLIWGVGVHADGG